MSRRSPLSAVLRRLGAAVLAAALSLEPAVPVLAQNAAPVPYTTLTPRPRPIVRPPAAGASPAPSATAAKPAAPARIPAPAADPVRLEAYVDGVVAAAMQDGRLAGAAVSVVQNGQVVMKKGYGVDRLSPRRAVDPDRTLFRLGGLSQTFTWIALQKQIEAGRMRFDAPVNLYLPERLQLKDQGFKTPVRLRDLMTQTDGFEDRTLGQLFERDGRRVRPLNQYLRQEQPRRVREPGQAVTYGHYGAGLAAAAIANVEGKPFERVIEEEVLGPAGLSRTTFREPRPEHPDLPPALGPALAGDLSEGFGWHGGAFAPRPFEFGGQNAPAVSASSTAADMARFMSLLLDGGVVDGRAVYSPTVDRALRTPLYRPAVGAAGWTGGLQDIPLAGGRRGLGHAGRTLSFAANMVLVPSLNLGVFVAVNSEAGAGLAAALPGEILREMFGPPQAPPAFNPEAPASTGLAGRYLTTQRAYVGLEAFVDRLQGRVVVASRPAGALTVRMDAVDQAWLPSRQPGLFVAANGDPAPLVIQADAAGRGRTLFAPSGAAAYERQGLLDSLSLMIALAALAAACALATIGGLFIKAGAATRQTLVQSRAALSQALQAALWIIAMVAFGLWLARAGDRQHLVYDWPGGALITASACALVAAVLGGLNLLLLPVVWRGGRRVDSWTLGRKFRFSVTSLVFVAFAALVGLWGGLSPWVS